MSSQTPANDRGPNISTRIIRVTGSVQGVGFRRSAAKAMERLGLTGTANNLTDGSVEMEVEGRIEALEAFTKWARSGPFTARVDTLEWRDGSAAEVTKSRRTN
ncbi:MAG: acylphosphatase [Flavobacteriales bacterium]|nr:acylphosphatase [Flavobacteriales bacterium]